MKSLFLLLTVLLSFVLLFGCHPKAKNTSQSTAAITSDRIFSTTGFTQSVTVSATATDALTTCPITTDKRPITEPIPNPPEGEGRLTALILPASENPSLANDLCFTVDEESLTATLTVNYQMYADFATLTNAHLTAICEGGSASFTAADKNGQVDLISGADCVVTDAVGGVRIYKLVIDRTVYKLPIVNITLDKGIRVNQIDRELASTMTFSLDCSTAKDYESLGNISGKIRGRGNSTWSWDKKPYKITLDKSESLLGMDDNKDWILLANYTDKSLIRNTLAYEMARVLSNIAWSPHQYPVDLFINGEYQGVYSLGEHMEVASGRVEISESSDPDTGYLIEIGGMELTGDILGVHYFHTDEFLVRFATFKSPDADTITDEQKEFIIDYFQKAENAIIAGEGYEEYIDVDSFVDWIILHELSYNTDSCFRRSCYLTKEKGGKLKMGPVWDFDLAFGNFSSDNRKYNNWVTAGSDDEDAYIQYNWCTYLLKDPEFCARLADRWNQIRVRILKKANSTINTYSSLLNKGSQQENFEVWQIWDTRVGFQSKWCSAANTYEKQIQYLKDFLQNRANWLDAAIEKLPE